VARSHTPRTGCVRFVCGVAAASRNTRFQAARYGFTWAGLAPADRASFAWRLHSLIFRSDNTILIRFWKGIGIVRRNLFWLSDEQWKRIEPRLPTDVRGVERVDPWPRAGITTSTALRFAPMYRRRAEKGDSSTSSWPLAERLQPIKFIVWISNRKAELGRWLNPGLRTCHEYPGRRFTWDHTAGACSTELVPERASRLQALVSRVGSPKQFRASSPPHYQFCLGARCLRDRATALAD